MAEPTVAMVKPKVKETSIGNLKAQKPIRARVVASKSYGTKDRKSTMRPLPENDTSSPPLARRIVRQQLRNH